MAGTVERVAGDFFLGGLRVVKEVHGVRQESAINRLSLFISRANEDITVVSESLEPRFYNHPWLLSSSEDFLKRGGQLRVAFHIAETREETQTHLERNNWRLTQLRKKFPERVSLFWLEKWPWEHYSYMHREGLFFGPSYPVERDGFVAIDDACFALVDFELNESRRSSSLFRLNDGKLNSAMRDIFEEVVENKPEI